MGKNKVTDDWIEEVNRAIQDLNESWARDQAGYKPYQFPIYIRNKETKLVYKLLAAYEDNPGALYTRQDDYETRVLLMPHQVRTDWETV